MKSKSFSLETQVRTTLRVFLVLLLLSPFLIWLGLVDAVVLPPWPELSRVLVRTFYQASWSATISLILGIFLVLGWNSLAVRWQDSLEWLLLLPNMIPQLLLIVSVMSGLSWIGASEFGLSRVVLAHVLLNVGLVAVTLRRVIQNQFMGLAELAWVEGASRWTFWWQGLLPGLRRDLFLLWGVVFALCFTSFSIPLILGGPQATTLEVFIFESIRVAGNWNQAFAVTLLQSLLIAVLSFVVGASAPVRIMESRTVSPLVSHVLGRPLLLLPFGFLVYSLFVRLLLHGAADSSEGLFGWSWHVPLNAEFMALLPEAAVSTYIVALSVGLLLLLIEMAVAYVTPHVRFRRFLDSYLAPSATMTGFAMLLLPGRSELSELLKLIFALGLLFFPLLHRWQGSSVLRALEHQVEVARTLGASWGQIFLHVVWPQARPTFLQVAGLGALWASGDFALTTLLGGEWWTMGLIVDALLGNYQIDGAIVVTWLLLAVGCSCYFFFVGVLGYVTDRTSMS